ncbi:MAG: DUF1036 domain-containing protein [Hyphomicrobiales bacterium]|nr:DUF1036 domain-containing protein [Hyphomicrobiales bacterium]
MSARTATAATVVAAVLLIATPAIADVTLCNRTSQSVSVAFGYLDGKGGWTSMGWSNLTPGECRQVYRGRMPTNVYYTHVTGTAGNATWSPPPNQKGGYFCVQAKPFTLQNRRFQKKNVINCESHGYETVQFTEFNTGGAPNITHNIRVTGSAQPPATTTTAPPPRPPLPPPTTTTAPTPPAPPSAGGTACERFPNLC